MEISNSLNEAESHNKIGNEYFNNKDYNNALKCYEKAIALSEKSKYLCNKSIVLEKLGRTSDALIVILIFIKKFKSIN